jgi:tetratricopeptide (TPR) repeat protein
MINRPLFRLLFILTVGFPCTAQDLSCALIKPKSISEYGININPDLNVFVEDCYSKLGLVKPYNLRVYEGSNIQNCFATYVNNEPCLVFDVNWLNLNRNGNDWGSLFVIGHEIGHLIEGHIFKAHEKNFEYEADAWGVRLLKSFGYPEDNLNESFPTALKSSKDSESHPDGASRLREINKELRNNQPGALSPFGLLNFDIDKWVSSDRKKIEALNMSILELSKNVTKETVLNHAEQMVYCQDLLRNSEFELLKLLEYGIITGIISPEDVSVYTRHISQTKDSYKYATRIFRIFKSQDHYKWFEEAIKEMSLQPLLRSLEEISTKSEPLSIYEMDILSMLTYMLGQNSEYIGSKEEALIIEACKASSKYNNNIAVVSNMCILNNILGDYSSAINWGLMQVSYWHEFSERVPNSDRWSQEAIGSSLYTLGISYFRNGDYIESIQTLNNGLGYSKNPTSKANMHFFLSRAHRKIGEYDNALRHIKQYENKNDPMFFRIYAQVLLDLGQKEKAKYYLTKGCDLKDNWACTKLKFL